MSVSTMFGGLQDCSVPGDQKGLHKRGIHDQGDFWKFPLETTLSFLSLVVWISLVNFKQGISLLKLEFSEFFSVFSKDFVGSVGAENPW